MDPITASVALRGVMGAGQLAYSVFNKPGDRPLMTVPSEIEEAAARSKNLATGSTDVIRQSQERQLNQSKSNSIANLKRTSSNANDIIGGLSAIDGQANQANQAISDAYGNRRLAYNQQYNQDLKTKAQYKQQAFNYNKIAPYEEAVTANNQLSQAGLGNIADATDMYAMYSAIKKPKLYEDNRMAGIPKAKSIKPSEQAGGLTIPNSNLG